MKKHNQNNVRGTSVRYQKHPHRSPIAYVYILPALSIFLIFLGIPLCQTIQYSLFNWDGLSAATYVGTQNYVEVFSNKALRDAFIHALILVIFYAIIPVLLALLLTMLISRSYTMKSMSFYRTILFLPQVIASVVVATMWVSMYAQDGAVNQILRSLGLGSFTHIWLGEYSTALPAVGVVGTWLNIGLCLVLFLSGVGNIPPELYEACALDGASRWEQFIYVTLPHLRGQIVIRLTLTVISAFKAFDLVYVTTRGGPGSSTTVPAWEAYNRAFNVGQVGLASAIAIVLTLLIILITKCIGLLDTKEVA